MGRFFKSRGESLGKKPGELIFVGKRKNESIRISLIDYNRDEVNEIIEPSILENPEYINSKNLTWINIDGLHDLKVMKSIKENYSLHPIMIADILNTDMRPKIEEFDDGLFFVLKMIRYVDEEQIIVTEQFSMILKDNQLLTFQEQPGDVFDPVRERIRSSKGRIRSEEIDYLAYSLVDSIVDNYISIVEKLGNQIEDIEEDLLLSSPQKEIMEKIILLKREIIFLRKSIRPAIEAVQFLLKCESDLISESTRPFLRDLHTNIIQVSEAIDTYREMLTEQLNTYNSLVSNNLNDIMKFLTIFSVVFIPLTFVAGIYGTNFDFIPELHFKYGYLMLWGIFVVITGIMLWIFKRKKWL